MVIEELRKKVSQLDSTEYENLVVAIFIDLLGRHFYPGPATKDGGRDGWYYGPILLSSETMIDELRAIQKKNYKWVFQVKHVSQKNLNSTINSELKKGKKLIELGYEAYILIVGFSVRNSERFVFEETEKKFIEKGFNEFKILGIDAIVHWLFKMDKIKDAYFPTSIIIKRTFCNNPRANMEKVICDLTKQGLIAEVSLQSTMNATTSWRFENKIFHYIRLQSSDSIRKALEADKLLGYNEILVIEASANQHELLIERMKYIKVQLESVEEIKNIVLKYNNYIFGEQSINWSTEPFKRNIRTIYKINSSIDIHSGKLDRIKQELSQQITNFIHKDIEYYNDKIIFNFQGSRIEVLFKTSHIKISTTTPIMLLNLSFEFMHNIRDMIISANTNDKIMEIGGNLFMMNLLIYNWVNIISVQFGYGIYNIQNINTREVSL